MANQQYPTATAYNPELYPNQQYQQQPNQQYQYAPVAQGAGQKPPMFTECDAMKSTVPMFSAGQYKAALCPPITHCLCCFSLRIGLMILALTDLVMACSWTGEFFSLWFAGFGYRQYYGWNGGMFGGGRGLSFLIFPIIPTMLYGLVSALGIYGAYHKISSAITVYLCNVVFGVILFAIYAGHTLLWFYFLNWGIIVSMAYWKLIIGMAYLNRRDDKSKAEVEELKRKLAEKDATMMYQQQQLQGQLMYQQH